MEIIPVYLGGDEFAFSVEVVGSIMPVPLQYEPSPEAQPYVKGCIPHRTQMVQVQDLRERFGYDPTGRGIMLVLDDERGQGHGFIVDDASSPVRLKPSAHSAFQPLPTGTLLDGCVKQWLEPRHTGSSLRGYYILALEALV